LTVVSGPEVKREQPEREAEREREREREREPTKVFLTEKGSSKHEKVMHEVEDMAGSAYREGRQYKTLTETGVKRLLFLCYKRIPQC
jgi:hypothetical protein